MARLETYVGTWTIKSWTLANLDPNSSGLPPNGFGAGSELVISEGGAEWCSLSWWNGHDKPCRMHLPFIAGRLQGDDVPVDFAGGEVRCASVTIQQGLGDQDELELTGTLYLEPEGGSTGNAGTFVAQATGGPPDGEPRS